MFANYSVGRILRSTYKKVCDDMEAFIANKSKPAELRGAVFGWMAEYPEEYHHLMSYIVHLLKAIKEDSFEIVGQLEKNDLLFCKRTPISYVCSYEV